jgi:hypothetical protein
MIWNGDGKVTAERFEPVFRSCWECNNAHEHLRNRDMLHTCIWCEKTWVAGVDFSAIDSEKDFDAAMTALGLKPGQSTIGNVGEPGEVFVVELRVSES